MTSAESVSVPAVEEKTAESKAPYFSAPSSDWWRAFGFLFACSLTGLNFYPALLLVAAILYDRWKKDRYFFLVELIIVCTGSGLIRYDLSIKPCDFAFLFGVFGMVIYRKNGLVRKITWAMLAYFAVLFILAFTSVEPMSNQIAMIRYYLLIIGFFIPLVTFADREFDFNRLLYVIVLHTLAICVFYVVDAFFFFGFILTPGSSAWGTSTILHPIIFYGLPRHYPYGLYWLLFLVVPINYKTLRLKWYYWVLILLALVTSRTNSMMFALLGCFIFIRPKFTQALKYVGLSIVLLGAVYVVDKPLGSPLRVAENIDQFAALRNPDDIEAIAQFGTGRMAQILPKMELLYDLDREWIGLGFLNRLKTTNPIFQIDNILYIDSSKSEEVASGVEVTQIQTILDVGYLGFIIQLIFYIGVYFMIRRLPYSNYYLCLILGFELLGIGGFAGLNGMQFSLLILGLALGAIILNHIRHQNPL